MRGKILVLLMIPIGVFLIVICIMQLHTNSIMREIKVVGVNIHYPGFNNEHQFKLDILGKNGPISQFNIHIDTNTGELFLVGIKTALKLATGIFA